MRLFTAIELDHPTRRELTHVVDKLADFRRTVRWVKEQHMHLTLKFLGEVPDDRLAEICDACKEIATEAKPFEFVLHGAGCFPPEGPVRIVWGGGAVMPAELAACVAHGEMVFERLGFAREHRPFSPHATIGRVKVDDTHGQLRRAVAAVRVTRLAEHVSSLTLFQSELSPAGAHYTALGKFPFGGG